MTAHVAECGLTQPAVAVAVAGARVVANLLNRSGVFVRVVEETGDTCGADGRGGRTVG